MRKLSSWALWGTLLAGTSLGCGDEPAWVGTYDVEGAWKLSGPLEGGQSVGDATAQLLCDEVTAMLPAPSFVEDQVRDWLEQPVCDRVGAAVDSALPPDLAPDGRITRLLGQALASVAVESTLVLSGDDDELSGTEEFTALAYTVGGQPHRVSAADLGVPSGISAKWSGTGGERELSIDPHPVALRYGELVRLVAADLLQSSELAALESGLSAALGCGSIVGAVVGSSTGLTVSLAGWSHTIDRTDLETVCATVAALIQDRALGQFELDTRVEVGGTVGWSRESDSESGAITLRSGADFGGVVNVGSTAIAPKLEVQFTARRQ